MEAVADTEAVVSTKYANYKDSKVNWVGKIPAHWEVKPGFTVVKQRYEKNVGMKEDVVLSLSYGKVIVKAEEKLTGLVPESFETYQLVYPGDIIIRPTDLQNDKTSLRTGLSQDKGIITSAYIDLAVINNHLPKYFYYYLHCIDSTKVIYGLGSGLRQNIDFGDFKRLPFVIPPLSEQSAIANFLDQKIEQIDKAIAQKERQIELLKERQQILIHKAVTRGLNPHVKLKDSGVEWIGEIPEHWEVKRLKHIATIKGGYAFDSNDFRPEGVQIIKIANTYLNELSLERQPTFVDRSLLKSHKDWIVKKADILMSLTGTLGKRDYGYAILIETEEQYLLNQRVAKITVKPQFSVEYTLYVLQSEMYLNQLYLLPAGTKQANLSNDNVINIKIPIPPSDKERRDIAFFIKHMKVKNGQLITIKQQEIEKLKEYRSTLINSAVTGKIKVC